MVLLPYYFRGTDSISKPKTKEKGTPNMKRTEMGRKYQLFVRIFFFFPFVAGFALGNI